MSPKDRELLEMAARAVDYYPWGSVLDGPIFIIDGLPLNWNPLADDGDALRLAVKLNFEIERSKLADRAYVGAVDDAPWVEYVSYEQDIYVCTRRAIVCAAAEIGKSMSATVFTSEEGK